MSSSCRVSGCSTPAPPPRYRRALWIALVINLALFGIEIGYGWASGSVSLLADAVDFLGDAANYALSLLAMGMAVIWRSRVALIKGYTMGGYGLLVLGQAAWHATTGVVPQATTMGAIAVLALLANGTVATLLFTFRTGDANMRSVWLCTRNDMIGNLAVMAAAAGVFGTAQGWPDLVVASGMAILGLSAAYSVVRQANVELRMARLAPAKIVHAVRLP